mgnify:CR=1 FL=1
MRSKCKCGKSQPTFNFTGSKPKYCSKYKLPGMISVKKKITKSIIKKPIKHRLKLKKITKDETQECIGLLADIINC